MNPSYKTTVCIARLRLPIYSVAQWGSRLINSGQPTFISRPGQQPMTALIQGYTGGILYVGQKFPF
jgi:hypothetical protein